MSASMKECLQLQLLEMEMLFSMFPNQGEVTIDVNALTNIKRYLDGIREALPPKNRICDHPADLRIKVGA